MGKVVALPGSTSGYWSLYVEGAGLLHPLVVNLERTQAYSMAEAINFLLQEKPIKEVKPYAGVYFCAGIDRPGTDWSVGLHDKATGICICSVKGDKRDPVRLDKDHAVELAKTLNACLRAKDVHELRWGTIPPEPPKRKSGFVRSVLAYVRRFPWRLRLVKPFYIKGEELVDVKNKL